MSASLSVVDACSSSCSVTGGDYSSGTFGTGSIMPQLVATDGACLGSTPTIDITVARGGAPGLLVVGFAYAKLPACGGQFVLNSSTLMSFPVFVDGAPGVAGAGSLSMPTGTDLTSLKGITLYMQALTIDPLGTTSKALTHGASCAVL